MSNPSAEASLAPRSVLLAGVGNIGSFLAPLLAQAGVGRILLADRDVVEDRNLTAQNYRPEDVGRPKALVQAETLQARFPGQVIDSWVGDLEDLPLGLARRDLLLGALDSRRARQVLVSELAWPLGVPVIDGGVGDGGLGRVQVFVPGEETACLECTWGQADYRLLAGEYPCQPGAPAESAPTRAPAHLGCLTAALMASEAVRLLTNAGEPPAGSYEVVFDLGNVLLRKFGLRQASRCRYDHRIVPVQRTLAVTATFADLLCLVEAEVGGGPVSLECRRGLGAGSLNGSRHLDRTALQERGGKRLVECGFVSGDCLRLRGVGRELLVELRAGNGEE